MHWRKIALWSWYGLSGIATVLTVLFALPTAVATYECNFSGRSCQHSLYGPSEDAVEANLKHFVELAASDDARLTVSSTDVPNEARRVDLAVVNAGDQATIFSKTIPTPETGKDEFSVVLTDDRKAALVLVGGGSQPTLHIFALRADNRLVQREYQFFCSLSDGRDADIKLTNPYVDHASNMVSFDFNSNCSNKKEIQPNFHLFFGNAYQPSGRVTLVFDAQFFLVGAYPNVEWQKPPTESEIRKAKEESDLIASQIVLADAALEKCADRIVKQVMAAKERNFFYLCEVPETLAGKPTYWKLRNDRKIIAGSTPEKISVKDEGCDGDRYVVRRQPGSTFFASCEFRIADTEYRNITFVDPAHHINSVSISCTCMHLEIASVVVAANRLEFDVAASSPNFKFDEKTIVLGGDAHKSEYADASYRGRITAGFFEGGWLQAVTFVPP